jgi:hypothetical protein
MAAPIGPGDFVECIEACPFDSQTGDILPCPAVGDVCQVDGIFDYDGEAGLYLVGWNGCYDDGERVNFLASAFRPIYRRNDSIIAGLLKPIDDLVEA